MPEAILEPELPIIDPHHHLWDLRPLIGAFPEPRHDFIEALLPNAYYTFDQLHAHLRSGHNIVGSVFVECGAFYDADASGSLGVVGEVEFANGVAAQSASGLYGELRACAGIVGHADLQQGDAVAPVLEALRAAAPRRLRGIRQQGAWDADPSVLGPPFHAPAGLYRDACFREGFAHLGRHGLSFDAWVLEPQLADVIDLARAFPEQPICLDHCGTPLNIASYRGTLPERFAGWRHQILELARCENVVVKLGGLAMAFCGMPERGPGAGLDSATLAELWRPYVETCIEAFGAQRAMFESNYPVDYWGADYAVLWNAFKRITRGAGSEEKRALYAGNAARFYRLDIGTSSA